MLSVDWDVNENQEVLLGTNSEERSGVVDPEDKGSSGAPSTILINECEGFKEVGEDEISSRKSYPYKKEVDDEIEYPESPHLQAQYKSENEMYEYPMSDGERFYYGVDTVNPQFCMAVCNITMMYSGLFFVYHQYFSVFSMVIWN